MIKKTKDKTIFGKATETRGFLWFYRAENAAKRNAFDCSPKMMLGQNMKHSVLTSLFWGLSGKGSGTTWTHRRQIEQQAQGK